jgi:DNA-directed RNA polymerase specialized sigma subunit
MNKIVSLTHQQEIKLLKLAQKAKSKQEREKATRLLVYYNQPFVKFLVRGAYYPQSEISPEDLVTEGTIALIKAIENFELAKAKKYRLASYAGY